MPYNSHGYKNVLDHFAKCKQLTGSLTFFKDFSLIPAGTYSGTSKLHLLRADFARGSRNATFTSTDGNFTIGANGYHATTANDEVLSYLIANNRTAATESIIIVFTPDTDFANDGVARYLSDTDTLNRSLRKLTASNTLRFYPGGSTSNASSNITHLANTSYCIVAICYGTTAGTNARMYSNGVETGTTTTDYDDISGWGTKFYIGCANNSATQLNGYIKSAAFFNRPLSASEAIVAYNLMS